MVIDSTGASVVSTKHNDIWPYTCVVDVSDVIHKMDGLYDMQQVKKMRQSVAETKALFHYVEEARYSKVRCGEIKWIQSQPKLHATAHHNGVRVHHQHH
jgi:hypothetical protein